MTQAVAPCPHRETLKRFLRDELARTEASVVEAHVGDCAGCQRLLQGLVGDLPDTLGAIGVPPPAPLTDDQPPALPGYATMGRLDAGGMGVVWRVRDLQFRRSLAVKVMKSSAATSGRLVERFVAEARICGQLAHPAIVPVHAMGRLPDGRPYYAMKLVEGKTLAALLDEGADTGRMRLVQIFGQVCQAVAFAHANGVIHRDLKPHNVMIGTHGEVQLMDWGLAKILDVEALREASQDTEVGVATEQGEEFARTQAGSVLGTLSYMPPEQARGQIDQVDRRSDVFGLGAILCEILTGAPPYTGADVEAVRWRVVQGELEETQGRLRGCGADPELITLAERCLAAQPEKRPADGGEVAAAVAAYLTGVEDRLQQARLERERQEVRASEERRRRSLWLGLAAAVLAFVGLAAGGGMYWQGQRNQRHAEATEALEGAEGHLRAGQFVAAKDSLTRARGRLEGGSEALVGRYNALQAAWQLVGDLDRIEQKRTTVTDDNLFDNDTAQRSYVQTFADAGFDLLGGDPTEVAERIRRSPVREPILVAIDNWALVCAYDVEFVPTRKEEYRHRRDRLMAVARAIDPDPAFRDKLRDTSAWENRERLEKLAEEAVRADLSPRLAALLAELVRAAKGDPEQLLRAYQRRYPGDFWLNFDLGRWLDAAKPAEAVHFYHAALAVRPHHVGVHYHVVDNLRRRGLWDEAIALTREWLAGRPEKAPGVLGLRDNLAMVFVTKGEGERALELFAENVRLWPDQAGTHLNHGILLLETGRFAEGVEAIRRGRDLAFAQGSYRLPQAEQLLREVERQAELDRRLRTGQAVPVSGEEAFEFAEVCGYKRHYAEAVGFYRWAFAQKVPSVTNKPRYPAACAAALAAAGQGENTSADAARRAEWRRQALVWLRRDLAVCNWRVSKDAKTWPTVEAELRLWRQHPHLKSVRDAAELVKLPKEEQQAWERLWGDVHVLLARVQAH